MRFAILIFAIISVFFFVRINNGLSLQDIYTRAPITKMISTDGKKPKPQQQPQYVLPAATTLNAPSIYVNLPSKNPVDVHSPYTPYYPVKTTAKSTPSSSIHMNIPSNAIVSTYHASKNNHDIQSSVATEVNDEFDAMITSTSTSTTPPASMYDEHKFSSHYNADVTPLTTSGVSMRPNVKDLLAKIGLKPETSEPFVSPTMATRRSSFDVHSTTTPSTTTTTTTAKPEMTPELKEILESFGMFTNESPAADITAASYQDEFQPFVPPSALRDDRLHVTEFKPLPASLIGERNNEANIDADEPIPKVRATDFGLFKPLPIPDDVKTPKDSELEELLKTYGLLDGGAARDSKSLVEEEAIAAAARKAEENEKKAKIEEVKTLEISQENVPFLSSELIDVLDKMGIAKAKVKSTTTTTTPETPEWQDDSNEISTEKLSSPTTAMPTENDYDKLHHLLDTIKELEKLNSNLTETEFEALNLRNFNLSDDLLAQGPDPIDDIYSLNDVRKNEIKRRQSGDDTSSSTSSTASTTIDADNDAIDATASSADLSETTDDTITTTSTTTTEATTTTEESKNGSIKDLADSFGGTSSGLDAMPDEELPPPKQNGFYFFTDWNSFLEVGEDPDKTVVRFDPKIGDPRRFVPVKIP